MTQPLITFNDGAALPQLGLGVWQVPDDEAAVIVQTAIDAGGLLPDLHDQNSWTQMVHEVDALELLEVQLANATAPFILISRLRAAMAASPAR